MIYFIYINFMTIAIIAITFLLINHMNARLELRLII